MNNNQIMKSYLTCLEKVGCYLFSIQVSVPVGNLQSDLFKAAPVQSSSFLCISQENLTEYSGSTPYLRKNHEYVHEYQHVYVINYNGLPSKYRPVKCMPQRCIQQCKCKRSAGVAPEVNLRIHCAKTMKYENEGIHPGFESQSRCHQQFKPGVSVVAQKGLRPSKHFF